MAASAVGIRAEDGFFRNLEAEVFVGPNLSLGKSPDHVAGFVADSKTLAGYTVGGEIRYNFSDIPFDCGIRGAFTKIGHDQHWAYGDYWSHDYTNNGSVAAVGDWQLNRGGNIAPFIGVGIGAAFHGHHGINSTTALFLPRFGMEIFDRLRISVGAELSKREFNTMNLTLGWTFGGGQMKLTGDALASMFKRTENPEKAEHKARQDWMAQTNPVEWETISKLRRQANTCKWVGVGTLCLGVPTLVFGGVLAAYVSLEKGSALLPATILGAGGLLTLSSIPLFIVSHSKSARASQLTLDISTMSAVAFSSPSMPAAGITLSF